ncbi:hypothetical protein NDU88_000972 [Pleurodeles waltl]|uniref:Uncharacterized protein n=1 Tax=Pleurodeles waltl TaxID=8319 RepID=A0AAV7TGY8_PLEWA|nr:hypothetical protein NDU88_000972 [Pleurodeles waltl]
MTQLPTRPSHTLSLPAQHARRERPQSSPPPCLRNARGGGGRQQARPCGARPQHRPRPRPLPLHSNRHRGPRGGTGRPALAAATCRINKTKNWPEARRSLTRCRHLARRPGHAPP